MRTVRLYAVLALLGLAGSAPAYEIGVGATLKPDTVTIGDRVFYEAAFRVPPGFKATPAFTATQFADWEVLGTQPAPPRQLPGGAVEQRVLVVLTVWTTSETATPALPFTISAPGVKPQTVTAPALKITVESVLAKAEDKANLRAPKGMVGFFNWWPYVGGAILLLALGLAIWAWRRRKRLKELEALGLLPGVPRRPPEEIAREALDALLASPLLEEGQVKLFYIQLGDILRRYLGDRFRISALDRTTAELLPELRGVAALRPLLGDVRLFFDTCDLVKFAKHVPDRAEIDGDVARARALVDQTSPRAAAPPKPVAASAS
ncbi:MAG: hypothetical protein AAB152_10800, partial [Candidatus Coatesbacteria bacterium]